LNPSTVAVALPIEAMVPLNVTVDVETEDAVEVLRVGALVVAFVVKVASVEVPVP
jgi:hypothetical protein